MQVGEEPAVARDDRGEGLGLGRRGGPAADLALAEVAREERLAAPGGRARVEQQQRQRQRQRRVEPLRGPQPGRAGRQPGHDGERAGGVGRHRPVGVGARQETLRRHHDHDRHREREQDRGRRPGPAPRGPRAQDHERRERDRAEDRELRGRELGRARGAQRALPVGVGGGVAQRGGAVERVPGDVGREHEERGCERREGCGGPQARRGDEGRRQRRAGDEEEGRILGQRRRAQSRAREERPAPGRPSPGCLLPGRGLDGPQVGQERRGEERQHHRVGRDHERAQRGHRQRGVERRRPGRRARPPQAMRARAQGERGGHVQKRRRQPDPERRVRPREVGRKAQEPPDQGRLGVVAEGRVLPPEPVLRLVHEELGVREREERDPPAGQGQDEGHARGQRAPPVPRRRLTWRHGAATGCARRRRCRRSGPG